MLKTNQVTAEVMTARQDGYVVKEASKGDQVGGEGKSGNPDCILNTESEMPLRHHRKDRKAAY